MSQEHGFQSTPSEAFSREQAAGYDPAVIEQMVVVDGGAGATGNNVVLNLSLVGVGEQRIVDMDRIDPSNYARSPGFAIVQAPAAASKARTLARAAAKLNPRREAIVRYAHERIEALGMGAFMGASVAVSAFDSKVARAYFADVTRFLGIPVVEVGFRYPRLHIAVYGNRTDEAVCWRCREPDVTTDRVGCSLYAERTVAAGVTPATQTLAAAAGAFAAEACVRLAHGDRSLDDTFTDINLQTFTVERIQMAAAERCPGVHMRAGVPVPIAVDYKAPVEQLLHAVAATVKNPVLRLASPYVASAPCARCGARVSVGLPSRFVAAAPVCPSCKGTPTGEPAPLTTISEISLKDNLRTIAMRRLGYRACDLVCVTDEHDALHVFRLLGGPEALFNTIGTQHASSDASSESALS